MLGIFDSGSGGLNTVRYIKRAYEDADAVYLIDRKNAPYGIKSEKELIRLTERNIDILKDMGAGMVLIACCTASTVYTKLSKRHRESAFPIIDPTAEAAARATENGRIGVIATRRTVKSRAFSELLGAFEVYESEAQSLVTDIDNGLTDDTAREQDKERLRDMLSPLITKNIDTLILGCTHFPSLIHTFEEVAYPLGVKTVINSAKEGADALMTSCSRTPRR